MMDGCVNTPSWSLCGQRPDVPNACMHPCTHAHILCWFKVADADRLTGSSAPKLHRHGDHPIMAWHGTACWLQCFRLLAPPQPTRAQRGAAFHHITSWQRAEVPPDTSTSTLREDMRKAHRIV